MGKHMLSPETVIKRTAELRKLRNKMMKNVDNLHVVLQKGNVKTGSQCWTSSFAPVIDCKYCKECRWECYDLRNDVYLPAVANDRCRNSAIHKADPERYWRELDVQVKANFITQLRLNVGGDMTDDDFAYIKKLGEDNPKVMILFFTKNYNGINKFLDTDSFPDNVHPIMSAWKGVKMVNPHNLPCSHVLYEDGSTTAPEYGAVYCGGNCTKCAYKGEGCWNLKRGEHVIFKVH